MADFMYRETGKFGGTFFRKGGLGGLKFWSKWLLGNLFLGCGGTGGGGDLEKNLRLYTAHTVGMGH